MKSAVFTLFEGDYHFGAAALINSLHAAGFSGTIVCGHRGKVPPWHEAVRALAPQMEVKFTLLNTPIHLTNYKPIMARDCWRTECQEADQVYYFDPDIVVRAPWSVLTRWARDGVALSEDVNSNLPNRHPYRLAWHECLERAGRPPRRTLDRYYNAGFFGLPRAQALLLDDWQTVLDIAQKEVGALDRIKNGDPSSLFHTIDQDALNMALLLNTVPINAAGPESMDFVPGGHLLSHAAGTTKPWRGGFVRSALMGRPPSGAQKSFFNYAAGPVRIFSAGQLNRFQVSLKLGAFIGRFYRRLG